MKVPSVGILDRDFSLAITREIRDAGGPMLREVVDEGIRVFERCSATATGRDEQAGVLFPYLGLIESLDGVEVTLASACTVPAELILRTTFESLLAVDWVAADPSFQRAAAVVVAEIHQRIKRLERFEVGSRRRTDFESVMASDDVARGITLPLSRDGGAKIAGLRALLREEHLVAAADEYDRTVVEKRIKNPAPYALWDGPRNLEQLARRVGRGGQYEMMYRKWSRSAHVEDLERQLGEREGETAVHVFRSGADMSNCYVHAATWGMDAMRALLKLYRPAELDGSFKSWYARHVREPFIRLARIDRDEE